jgi:hypothetical protein
MPPVSPEPLVPEVLGACGFLLDLDLDLTALVDVLKVFVEVGWEQPFVMIAVSTGRVTYWICMLMTALMVGPV